jgi:hypothetical protein
MLTLPPSPETQNRNGMWPPPLSATVQTYFEIHASQLYLPPPSLVGSLLASHLRLALGAGKRGRRPGPPILRGLTPSMYAIGISYMYMAVNCQGPLAQQRRVAGLPRAKGQGLKQFCIWRPREAIPSWQVCGHTRTLDVSTRLLISSTSSPCAAGRRRRARRKSGITRGRRRKTR